MSKVVLVGAGPGDPGLLTIKGKEYIEKADCILYDRLASKKILEYAKPECELVFVGKENHHHVMKQDDINEFMAKRSKEVELLVRLKGGDPYVFGRGGEEAKYLKDRGIDVEIVSGVTSAVAVAADAGIPITHRGFAKGFFVITAHSKKDLPSEIDYSKLLDEEITLVFLMGLSHVGEIADGLIQAGRNPETKIAVISNGTTSEQKKVIGNLGNICELVKTVYLKSPAIIVVGEVVSLANELNFFEERPLFGKKCLVPYIEGFRFSFEEGKKYSNENRLGGMLIQKGAIVNSVKVGRIQPIIISGNLLSDSSGMDKWLVFTSVNGIHAFMYNLEEKKMDVRNLFGYKIATVGGKTAKALESFGLKSDLTGSLSTGAGLALELLKIVNKDSLILHYTAAISDDGMKLLSEKCDYRKITIYENETCDISLDDTDADYSIFTSASSAARTAALFKYKIPGKIVSIGATSTKALNNMGIDDVYTVSRPSYDCIVEELCTNKA